MKKFTMLFVCLVMLGLQVVNAQQRTITGKVTSSEDGMSLPGVSVAVKGTTTGTITNIDGAYSLDVPADAQTLVFSFVGMIATELAIGSSDVIDVIMDPEVFGVDEVVIVAYGTSTKGSFTGSAAVVKTDELEKRQVANISNALAGSVAGVQVLSNNGQPGSSATIRVRGVGSINSGTDPLYVVDGVPFDGDLSSLSTSDIESMTILKDAASTALYGARGANGIIMVTTKKGKMGEARINFDAKMGMNSRSVKNYDVLTSPQNYTEQVYNSIYNAGIYNLGYNANQANAYANDAIISESDGGYGYQIYTLPNGENLIGINGKLNPNAMLGYKDDDFFYTPDNWSDETFQSNARKEYNLSVSGATDKQNYYMSVNYLDDQGIVSSSGFNRISGRFKGDQQVKDWLKIGANFNYNKIKSNYPDEQTSTSSSGNAFFIANYIAPVYPLYVRDAESEEIMTNVGRKVYDYGDGQSTNFSRSFMAIANPAGDLIYNKRDYIMDIMNTSWFAELTPIEGLKITAKYGLNVDNTRYNNMGNAYMGQSAAYGGTAFQEQDRTKGFDQQYVAYYMFNVDDIHQFDITAGYDGYNYENEYVYGTGQNLYNPESYYISNSIDQLSGGGGKDTYATEGFFSRINYSYNDTYFGNIAYRRDGSSRFSPDNRWGDFYSASAAWMLSKEDFLDVSWINLLKLKASFGQQGNDDIEIDRGGVNGPVNNYYPYMDQYMVGGSEGTFADGLLDYKGNPDLTWETTTSYNFGTDFTLFDNMLAGSIEYFGRKSTEMLYYKPVAGSLGYNFIPMNIGSMTNSGLEIDLNYDVYQTKDITVNINANSTFIKNRIKKLHADLEGELVDGTRVYTEGESMYRMYLVEYDGVDSETGMAMYWTDDEDGNRILTDDYSTAIDNRVATEDLLPKVYGGFGATVNAYGFDASVQCSYQLGGKIYDAGYRRLMHGGTSNFAGNNWHKDIYDAWTPENVNTDVPRLNANDKYANSISTRWITSSNYLSLNSITFGYTLPKTITNTIKVDKVRVYLSADNVALFSKRKGLDPRQSFTTATTARYTTMRAVSGGINLTF